MYSLVIPIYNNEDALPKLLDVLGELNKTHEEQLEVIFVIDGSPDNSYTYLKNHLSHYTFKSRLLLLSRNFGAFAAIRAGLIQAKGPYFAVMAADLQEPPELIKDFFSVLKDDRADVVVGTRVERHDPFLSRLASSLFWACYRKWIHKDIPKGGVDIFGCNLTFRNELIKLEESNSSLIGLIFWMGFRRVSIPYQRLAREHGKSAWTFKKKLRYLNDSVFSFSDLPIRLLITAGAIGILISILLGGISFFAKLFHVIHLPGYTTLLMVMLFFTALNALCLGIIGAYVWRAFENSKNRPQAIVMFNHQFLGKAVDGND